MSVDGPLADMQVCSTDVRFRVESGHGQRQRAGGLWVHLMLAVVPSTCLARSIDGAAKQGLSGDTGAPARIAQPIDVDSC